MAGPSVRFSRVRPGCGAPTGDTMVKIRKAMICALSAVLVVFSADVAGAQTDYPNRPIHFIVGFAAGGGNDLFARLVVQKFQENTGATAVIDNRVGAGGRIAAEFVSRQPPDGYSVLVGATGQMSIATAVYSDLTYHASNSFIPLNMEAGKTRAGPRREPSNNGDRDRDRDRRVQFALSVSDPKPVMEVAQIWRTAAQSATIGIFIILFVVALSLARPILLPVASAFVVTMMLGPLSVRAERYRVPSIVSAIVLWLLVVVVFYGVIVLLAAPVVDWIGKGPDIGRSIQEKLRVLDRPLAVLQDLRDALLPTDKKGGLGVDIMLTIASFARTNAIGHFGSSIFLTSSGPAWPHPPKPRSRHFSTSPPIW